MCSIFSILDIKSDASELRQVALEMSKLLRHRGPDWSGIYADEHAILAHERLAIVDVDHGAQPLISQDGNIVLAVNGEIYNHKQLKADLGDKYQYQTNSDCEVILSLYQEYGSDFLDKLNGIFAFVLYDKAKNTYLVGRDHMGIIPLYSGHDSAGNFYIASEMKALMPVCKTVAEFLPGQYLYSADGKPTQYYVRDWMEFDAVQDNPASVEELRDALEAAVKRQLMSDVPYGVLLSGGLDSSIVSAITQTYAKHRIENDGETGAWWPQLHSFAVGLAESPDLVAAQKAALAE